jgi:ribose transport system substrate-binding protein
LIPPYEKSHSFCPAPATSLAFEYLEEDVQFIHKLAQTRPVALITSIPGVGSLDQRAKGFKEEIAAKYPGLKLVADKVADGMPTTGLNIMTDLITSHADLRGVFASNLTMAQGASQAIAENKVSDKIQLIGFDSDDKTVKLLADGTIKALVVQDPFRMGYEGIKTAFATSKGEKVPENVDTGVNLITKENMNSARSKEHLGDSYDG